MYNLKHNAYKYNQSSQQQDSSQQDEHISPTFLKSHVFNNKQLPLVRSCDDDKVRFKGIEENDENGEGVDKEQQEEELHLRPKLRVQSKEETKHLQTKSNKLISDNVSGISAKSHSMSQVNLNKKAVNAAYTFKLKSPNPAKKKHDPVSLFQQTANSWKKDKFLTSRTDLKQGRKLQLQKRNKQYV